MLARFERRQRHLSVEVIGHRNAHGIDVLVREEIPVITIALRDVEPLNQLRAAIFIEPCQREHLRARLLLIPLQVNCANAATYNSDANVIHRPAPTLTCQRHAPRRHLPEESCERRIAASVWKR